MGGPSLPQPLSWAEDEVGRKKKNDSFVILPRKLLRGDKLRAIGYPARFLYLLMRDALFDPDDDNLNTDEKFVSFGPRDAEAYGMWKATYYRALDELINMEIISEVRCGGHGRRGIYDLTVWEWS